MSWTGNWPTLGGAAALTLPARSFTPTCESLLVNRSARAKEEGIPHLRVALAGIEPPQELGTWPQGAGGLGQAVFDRGIQPLRQAAFGRADEVLEQVGPHRVAGHPRSLIRRGHHDQPPHVAGVERWVFHDGPRDQAAHREREDRD